jgi:tetratricopeptide (TPR) repeat protein/serine/threonine protein kinase
MSEPTSGESSRAPQSDRTAAFAPASDSPPTADLPPVRLLDPDGATLAQPADGAAADGEAAQEDLPERYRYQREIARGGMGRVLLGQDLQLGREIAFKVLLEQHSGRAELVRRFIEEAQIAGQLQHPGIVPIYDIGTLSNRLPYFTMKLVKGRTLADLLLERKSPEDDLTGFLGIFEKVAQTVAFAHSKGVIHRDLKPSNIMVGAFGEVQVMDWGLAKVLGPQDPFPESNPSPPTPFPRSDSHTARPEGFEDSAFTPAACSAERGVKDSKTKTEAIADSPIPAPPLRCGEGLGGRGLFSGRGSGDRTELGSILGTPAYMAPEQARGEIHLVDDRADVFGLGGILCVILTGRPPYDGPTMEQVHLLARQTDLADAFARLDRCSAETDLVNLARACLSPDPAKRPRNAREVAAALAAHRAGVEKRLRAAEMDRAAAQARAVGERKARRLTVGLAAALLTLVSLAVVGWRWSEAQRYAQAQRRAEVERLVEADLAEVERLKTQARQTPNSDLWAAALAVARRAEGRLAGQEGLDDLGTRVASALAELQQEQTDRAMVGTLERARLRKIELKEDRLDFSLAAPDYARAFRDYGIDVQSLSKEEAGRRIAASRIRAELAAALDDWAEAPGKSMDGGALREIAVLGDPAPWRKRLLAVRRNRSSLRKLAADVKVDDLPAASVSLLAVTLARSGERQAAIDLLKRAHPRYALDFWINFWLGDLLDHAGRSHAAEAARYMMVARSWRPEAPLVHYTLGNILVHGRSLEEAIVSFREAIRLKNDFAVAYLILGRTEVMRQRSREAIPWFRGAIRHRPGFHEAHLALGNVLSDIGDYEGAAKAYQEAIRCNPKYALAYKNLGTLLLRQNKLNDAVLQFQLSLRYDEKAAPTHSELAEAYRGLGHLDAAAAEARQATRLQPNYGLAHSTLGNILLEQGKVAEAIEEFSAAIKIDPSEARVHTDLGSAYLKAGKFDAAITSFQAAQLRDAKDWRNHFLLGEALRLRRDYPRAIAEYRQAIAQDPKEAGPHLGLGMALQASGQLDQALEELRTAVQMVPKNGQAHMNLAIALAAKGLRNRALREFQEAVRLTPTDAIAHYNLGQAWLSHGKPEKAAESFARATRLDKHYTMAWSALATVLFSLDRIEEAVVAYRACVRLAPAVPSTWTRLGKCCADLGLRDESINAFRQVVALKPDDAAGWCRLGGELQRKGRLSEAVIAFRRGDAWGAGDPAWKYPSAAWLADAQRLAALAPHLADIISGKRKPANPVEQIDFALLSQCKGYDGAAARFFEEAFKSQPGLADVGIPRHRFAAAQSAARAGCGLGQDAGKLEGERTRWRKQALAWLRAELAHHVKQISGGGDKARDSLHELRSYGYDPNLATVRDKTALAKLPEAERADWTAFWADVDAVLKKAADGK